MDAGGANEFTRKTRQRNNANEQQQEVMRKHATPLWIRRLQLNASLQS
jgi:hypothetical protein